MIITTNERGSTVITADEGNIFRRKRDSMIFGSMIVLGMDYQVNPPHLEIPEDFEEIVNENPTLEELELLQEAIETRINTLENEF